MWVRISKKKPAPEGISLRTRIDDIHGVRNDLYLTFYDGKWWRNGNRVHYSPTHIFQSMSEPLRVKSEVTLDPSQLEQAITDYVYKHTGQKVSSVRYSTSVRGSYDAGTAVEYVQKVTCKTKPRKAAPE